ncbi:hypothetical protein IHE44_0001766 [Lamprotornis superbus]|uniref:G-protein coupled receptors family 1 profile domain-containing protein n=1 Tax=Lamprotornis superbus TaxID=245042 RepID=A0A835NP64_9PASS|nr:hypothetical protein IHE44_0001766 [Lamprotornis superbus]
MEVSEYHTASVTQDNECIQQLQHHKSRTASPHFSVICTLPSMVYLLWNESARGELCQLTETMYFINMLVSIYIISFISIDRYIAIKHPLKARTFRSPSKAALLCGLLWVLVISSASIQLWHRHSDLCFHTYTPLPAALSLLAIFFVFTLPLAILTFCSTETLAQRHLLRAALPPG